MAINNVQLGTSETTILLGDSVVKTALLSLIFYNSDSATRTITVYAYPNGSTAGDSTTIIGKLDIAPLDTYIWTANEKFIMAPLDKISGLCDVASKVTVTSNFMLMGS